MDMCTVMSNGTVKEKQVSCYAWFSVNNIMYTYIIGYLTNDWTNDVNDSHLNEWMEKYLSAVFY